MLFPADVFEQRALILVSIARFAIMPVVGIVSVMILSLLGALAWDPTCHLSVLLQSAMPPAQNLVGANFCQCDLLPNPNVQKHTPLTTAQNIELFILES